MTDAFLDTNVLVYLLTSDARKAARAAELLERGPTLSVQALNEFARVATRRFNVPWTAVHDSLAVFKNSARIVPLSLESHERAVAIAERYKLQVFDGHILAAAQLAGCDTVYSEDMQDGMRVGDLVVRNPL